MATKKHLKYKLDETAYHLVTYKDLYRQSADSRDFWKKQYDKSLDNIQVAKNKLRDEQELCDHLAEFLSFVVNNHNHLTPADITSARVLVKRHKESRGKR